MAFGSSFRSSRSRGKCNASTAPAFSIPASTAAVKCPSFNSVLSAAATSCQNESPHFSCTPESPTIANCCVSGAKKSSTPLRCFVWVIPNRANVSCASARVCGPLAGIFLEMNTRISPDDLRSAPAIASTILRSSRWFKKSPCFMTHQLPLAPPPPELPPPPENPPPEKPPPPPLLHPPPPQPPLPIYHPPQGLRPPLE